MMNKVSYSVLKEMYINLQNRHNVLMVLNNKLNRDHYRDELIHDCAITDNTLDNSVSHKAIKQLEY